MKVVVDTNVPAVANDLGNEFPECVAACARRLVQLQRTGILVLDDARRILTEYRENLRSAGQPGVGDAFLKWVLTNLWNPRRCCQVHITPDVKDPHRFAEFPSDPHLADFDPSDRKFVAVVRAHPEHPPVLQALDSRWWGFREALQNNGVHVDFVCQAEVEELDKRKRR